MKNPFKKSGIMDTAINVGIGGAANAAVDYAVSAAGLSYSKTIINAAKVAIGIIGGSLSKNKMVHAATDGIAVVGAAELVQSAIDGEFTSTPGENGGSNGLPAGTLMGRVPRTGNRQYKKKVGALDGAFGK